MIWLVFPFCCSDIMMRDNLFEVVTTSRTFYIQVRLRGTYSVVTWMDTLRRFWDVTAPQRSYVLYCLHTLHVSLPVTHFLTICFSLCFLTVVLLLSFSTRPTVQRRCTAGSRLFLGLLWPSGDLGGLLPQYVSHTTVQHRVTAFKISHVLVGKKWKWLFLNVGLPYSD